MVGVVGSNPIAPTTDPSREEAASLLRSSDCVAKQGLCCEAVRLSVETIVGPDFFAFRDKSAGHRAFFLVDPYMPDVRLPDGTVKSFEKPLTVADVAQSIGSGLARAALAGRIDGTLVDTLADLTAAINHAMAQFGAPLKTVDEARALHAAGQFAAGSMGPKIEAAIDFLEAVDGDVIICLPEQLVEAIDGQAGTHISRNHT